MEQTAAGDRPQDPAGSWEKNGSLAAQRSAFSKFLGLRWDDECTLRLTVKPDLLNENGLLLGPVGFALVDYSMGSALGAQTNPGELIATINIAINFIQGATEGDVICRSRLDRRNKRVAVLSSETHHEDGRLIATAVGSFSINQSR
jgi:acyl-CoA thioesterase